MRKSPKIVKLDIEEFDLESGVDAIALVESPAIELDFLYFSNQTFQYNDYPKAASENACKVLRWIDEHGRDEVQGMTQTGLARANQLCKRENISEETIARMAAFERHRRNAEINPEYEGTPWKDKGYVAWLGWGGDEGIAWAQRKLEEIRTEQSSQDSKFVENAGGFSIGDYVSWTFAGRGDDTDRGRGQIIDLRIQGKLKVPGTNFELSPTEERPAALIETIDGTIVGQYTENLRKIKKPENFEDIEEKIEALMDLVEYVDGLPVYVTEEEALEVARQIGCEGVHPHEMEDGVTLYMPCEEHSEAVDNLLKDIEDIYKSRKKKKNYISNLPQETQNDILDKLFEVGKTKRELEKEGWVVEEMAEVGQEEFAISSKPNLSSLEDYGKFQIRYQYKGPKDGRNRDFCRRMLDKDLIFRKEDINQLTIQGENSQFGIYDIFTYKGSYGCRHYWQRLRLFKDDEGKEVTQTEQSEDEATSVNAKPTTNRNPNGEDVSQTSDTITSNFAEQSKEKQLIAGPLMVPNKLIYRYDDRNGEYYVYFSPDTIEKIAYKYLEQGYQKEVNYEHSEDMKLKDITLVESWLVEDSKSDKSSYLMGEEYPKGTWFGIMKVRNKDVWNNFVKTGLVKGFSVEGFFADYMINASQQKFFYRTTEGGTEIVIDEKSYVVFILEDGERKVIMPDGEYRLTNGKTLVVVDSKAKIGSFESQNH